MQKNQGPSWAAGREGHKCPESVLVGRCEFGVMPFGGGHGRSIKKRHSPEMSEKQPVITERFE
jgi:hypothetical protein